jgi:hypothetical protein
MSFRAVSLPELNIFLIISTEVAGIPCDKYSFVEKYGVFLDILLF